MSPASISAKPPRTYAIKRAVLAPITVLVLLAGIAAEKTVFRSPSQDSTEYHTQVRLLASQPPLEVGDWDGKDVEVTPAAIALLRPNVLLNRQFVNRVSGERASLLLIHCRDARDLLGHFPPFCYPARGFALGSVDERDWALDGTQVPGKRYRFTKEELSLSTEFVVDNFMVLPSGEIVRDMQGVNAAAQDMRTRFFGAAQLQVLTEPGISDGRRDAVLRELVGPYLPLIRAIASGVER